MAKPIKNLELYYPMIQVLIIHNRQYGVFIGKGGRGKTRISRAHQGELTFITHSRMKIIYRFSLFRHFHTRD